MIKIHAIFRSHFFIEWLFCLFITIIVCGCVSSTTSNVNEENMKENKITIVIHGGAGNFSPDDLTPEERSEYENKLGEAADKGYAVLEKGGSSLDAIQEAIKVLEDSPLFNAGKGAVLTNDERIELDASIMNGATLTAGAVAGINTVKNPIMAARKVMENSQHVLLIGKGAEAFAKEQGLEIVDPSYFLTEKSLQQLKRIKEAEKNKNKSEGSLTRENKKFGTVGAVALDKDGNLAAGTSTGGMVNKRYGRVGDSPIIGAGTYANNKTCAVSCTGHGEFFIRNVIAYDLSAHLEYKKESIEKAASHIIHEKLKQAGGTGGLIAVDNKGNIAMEMNTSSMFRAYKKAGDKKVFIF